MTVLLLTILGALILLDKYAIGEFGISQPIITGTILGAIFGDIKTGIFLGSAFQLIFLAGLPIGRDIPPDGQGGGLVGCGAYFILLNSNPQKTALLISLILGLCASLYGTILEIWVRQQNEKLFHRFMRNEKNLIGCHLLGIVNSFLRGIIFLLPLFLLASSIHTKFDLSFRIEILTALIVGMGMANGLFLFIAKKNLFYYLLGLVCGLVLLVL
uniref:PTS sugar transporter subunit IIC n=1 Tax=candidate division WOR-3 bacterium TaxID=2052148 RepID=A0A7C4TDX0_UNCW3